MKVKLRPKDWKSARQNTPVSYYYKELINQLELGENFGANTKGGKTPVSKSPSFFNLIGWKNP